MTTDASIRTIHCEYAVIGSGAGGGTVAARLAEAGHSVVVLEAGGDPRRLRGGDSIDPDVNRLPEDYDVPAFHPFASENEAMRWDFFVRHYADRNEQQLDPKYREEFQGKRVDGVLYPRAGTLGGCTAHNAMILICPNSSDWDSIADLTKDESWRGDRMWAYFERMENCRYRPLDRWLAKFGYNPTAHGWSGWLHTEKAMPMAALRQRALRDVLLDSIETSFFSSKDKAELPSWLADFDPNVWRLAKAGDEGPRFSPLTTKNHARFGTREHLLETRLKHPDLRVELNALATKVIFDQNNRAIGVEYLHGERLYRAHPRPNVGAGEPRRVYASKEVIVAGGAFNTPQLLMLSGLGPRDVLERFRIPVRVDLPGVGQNLQDRYEVGVVNRMNLSEWQVYKNAKFSAADPQFREWRTCETGVYATNGSVIAFMKRSPVAEGPPDLFCMALLANFEGYYPGYSRVFAKDLNYLTWVVLKSHTRNRSGVVTLDSPDPRDPPKINFNYFGEGGEADLAAVVDGIRYVRKLNESLREHGEFVEESPGKSCDTDEDLKAFIRETAWGHHASCSCAIGPPENKGVLGSDFRVHGTEALRVVDASIFPRIPGYFIVSAVYMAAEKAAEVILKSRS